MLAMAESMAPVSAPGMSFSALSESMMASLAFITALPWATAAFTVPSAPSTEAFTFPTAALALVAAFEASAEDSSSTPVICTTKGPSACCVSESSADASESCWLRLEISPLAPWSLSFASLVLAERLSDAEERSATALRAS